jgi:hypothetical protein
VRVVGLLKYFPHALLTWKLTVKMHDVGSLDYSTCSRSKSEALAVYACLRNRVCMYTNISPAKDKEELLGWLSTHNFEFRKTKSIEACHAGTCNWLFATQAFEDWISSTTSKLMWCHGKRMFPLLILAWCTQYLFCCTLFELSNLR